MYQALEASLSEALSRVENLEHAQSVAAAARGRPRSVELLARPLTTHR